MSNFNETLTLRLNERRQTIHRINGVYKNKLSKLHESECQDLPNKSVLIANAEQVTHFTEANYQYFLSNSSKSEENLTDIPKTQKSVFK